MRLSRLLPALALAFVTSACVPAAAAPDRRGEVERIDAAVSAFEREAHRRTEHELLGFSLEGGELHGFYAGDELRKLWAVLYGEVGQLELDFYFADGQVARIDLVRTEFNRPFGEGGVRMKVASRLYLDGGALVHHVRAQQPAGTADDGSAGELDLPSLLELARRFSACAAAPPGSDRPECTAPVP